jgi:1-phosphofructokinase
MNTPVVTVTLNPALDQTVALPTLAHGAVNIAERTSTHPGGKGVNVASCLADWGIPVIATGILGRDNAAPFESLFLDKGIGSRFVYQAGATRVNIKLVSADDGETTDINLPGATVAPGTWNEWLEKLDDLSEPERYIVLSGSLPGGLPDDCYATLCERLSADRARVVLDTSGEALRQALAGHCLPYCIKPNRHELEQWAGRPLPTLEEVLATARALVARGVRQVIVSLAEEGALFVGAPGAYLAQLPPMRPVSSVGAGDALLAGWIAAQHEGRDWANSIRLALAFAAGKLSHIGPHLPQIAVVDHLAGEVSLTRLPG